MKQKKLMVDGVTYSRLEEAAHAKGAVNVDTYVKKLLEKSVNLRKVLEQYLYDLDGQDL